MNEIAKAAIVAVSAVLLLACLSTQASGQCVGGRCAPVPYVAPQIQVPQPPIVTPQPPVTMQLKGMRLEPRRGWYPGWFFGRPRPVFLVPQYGVRQ